MLFVSALLSELIYEKRIKASYMRVGSSPIYYLDDNHKDLERFGNNLKSKEKEAFLLLQERKFLEYESQDAPIRVALRQIRDFAIPFKINEKIFWRFFTTQESEFISKEKLTIKEKEETKGKLEILEKEKAKQEEKIEKKEKKTLIKKTTKSKEKTKTIAKAVSAKKNEQFFNKVKEFLKKKQREIIDIQGVTKDTLTLKIKEGEQEILLKAYNKKRLSETDIIKSYKKAQEQGLKCSILSLGEPSKKIASLLEALKEISQINKIE